MIALRVILREPERSDRPLRVILREPERSDRRPKDRPRAKAVELTRGKAIPTSRVRAPQGRRFASLRMTRVVDQVFSRADSLDES
jgi:hypothetical protein